MNLSMIQTTNQNESEHEWDSAVESVAPLQQPKHTDRSEAEQMIFMSPQTHRNSKSFVAFGKDEVNGDEVQVGAYDDSLGMGGMLTQMRTTAPRSQVDPADKADNKTIDHNSFRNRLHKEEIEMLQKEKEEMITEIEKLKQSV